MKILLIDDDYVNKKYVEKAFKGRYEIDMCSNGEEGFECFVESIKGEKYHFILVDIMMPKLNGFDLIAKIREFENENGLEASKIVVTTVLSETEYIERAVEYDVEKYLIKPIDLKDIRDL